MAYYELQPAPGRDYKTAAEVTAAFHAGSDFEGDFQMGFMPVNKQGIPLGSTVNLRYSSNRKLAVVKVTDHELRETVPAPKKATKPPSIATMQRWMMDGVAKATDGCRVEPDGRCEHGKPSWLLKMGLI